MARHHTDLEYTPPLRQRVTQLKGIQAVVCPMLLLMAYLNFQQGHTILAGCELIVLVCCFAPVLVMRSERLLKAPATVERAERLLLLGAAVIFIALIFDGGIAGTGLLWVPIFAFAAFYLRGIREGMQWILLFSAACLVLLPWLPSAYTATQLAMFAPAFVFYVLLAYLSNRYRLLNAQRLEQKVRERTARLRHLALHDPLTDLPNRTALLEHLRDAIIERRHKQGQCLILINCSRFQEINNLLGWHNGDMLLRQIANRLESFATAPTFAARLGADDFAVTFPGSQGLDQAIALRDLLEEPYAIAQETIEIETRIGIAYYPQHGHSPDALLRHADIALRMAKTIKKSPMIYSNEQNPYSRRRLRLFGQLRNAILHDQLLLYFQPKVSLADNRLVAVEALVRWQHPTEGMIPPMCSCPWPRNPASCAI